PPPRLRPPPWEGRSRARPSSGSAPSASAVEPTRSANSTDTILRSSPWGSVAGASAAASSHEPPVPQKRASGALTAPQDGHEMPSADPHVVQNRWSAALIEEHEGQTMPATR